MLIMNSDTIIMNSDPVTAHFSGVAAGKTYHQSIYLSIDDKAGALAQLHAKALASFGASSKDVPSYRYIVIYYIIKLLGIESRCRLKGEEMIFYFHK